MSLQIILSFTLFFFFFVLAHRPVIKSFCGFQFDRKWINEMTSVMLKGEEIDSFSICSTKYEYTFENSLTITSKIKLNVNENKEILYIEDYDLENETSN